MYGHAVGRLEPITPCPIGRGNAGMQHGLGRNRPQCRARFGNEGIEIGALERQHEAGIGAELPGAER